MQQQILKRSNKQENQLLTIYGEHMFALLESLWLEQKNSKEQSRRSDTQHYSTKFYSENLKNYF